MRVVLGIDAAWTLKQPSGVAVAKRVGTVWHLVELAPSYQRFNALVEHDLAPNCSHAVRLQMQPSYSHHRGNFAVCPSISSRLICRWRIIPSPAVVLQTMRSRPLMVRESVELILRVAADRDGSATNSKRDSPKLAILCGQA